MSSSLACVCCNLGLFVRGRSCWHCGLHPTLYDPPGPSAVQHLSLLLETRHPPASVPRGGQQGPAAPLVGSLSFRSNCDGWVSAGRPPAKSLWQGGPWSWGFHGILREEAKLLHHLPGLGQVRSCLQAQVVQKSLEVNASGASLPEVCIPGLPSLASDHVACTGWPWLAANSPRGSAVPGLSPPSLPGMRTMHVTRGPAWSSAAWPFGVHHLPARHEWA